jgi:hypothetical protein
MIFRPPLRGLRAFFASVAAALAIAMVAAAPAAGAAAFDPAQMPVVRQGHRGWAVLTLQRALNSWRAARALSPIAEDGDFGPQTRAAVVAFQWRHALVPDGVVGPITWSALAAATAGGTAPRPGPSAPGALAGWPQGPNAARQAAAWAAAALPGSFVVVDLAANGGRPVAVFLPAGFDPARPATLLTYFHGHGGSVGEGFARSGLFGRLRERAARHPQTIFVCAQAAAAPFSYWMRAPESFARLEAEALLVARDLLGGRAPALIASRIVAAHSGGGLALKNAVLAGTMRADRIELLDASYGDWAQAIAAWAAAQPGGGAHIEAWHTPGSTRTNDLDIARRYPGIVEVHDSAVSHGAVPARYLGTALDR